MTWQDTFRTKFKSARHAAEKLHAQWLKASRTEAGKVSAPSLATRINTLLKEGDVTGWWSKHSKLAGLLADLLDVDAQVILGVAPGDEEKIRFFEFPALPPLAKEERLCPLYAEGSLLDVVLGSVAAPSAGRTWIHAPAGCGKSMVVRHIQSHHSSDITAIQAKNLGHEPPAATILPLVIEVESPALLDDLESLARLAQHPAPVVVLASHPFPASGRAIDSAGWTIRDGQPPIGWRQRMLDWIDARLEQSDLDTSPGAKAVSRWLDTYDAAGSLVATPGNLLALCSDFHAHGDEGSLAVRSQRWLDEHAAELIPGDAPATWKSHAAVGALVGSVIGHFRSLDDEWGALGIAAWNQHIPSSTLAPARVRSPGSAVVVGYLQQGGLLRAGWRGFEPYPRWVAQGTVARDLEKDFERRSPGIWGLLAADESRRQTVDNSLDALSVGALRALARNVVKQGAPASLDTTGVLEATAAAVARRLGLPNTSQLTQDGELISQLLKLQVTTLTPAGSRVRPFTRPDRDEWFATGWALSLHARRPEDFDRSDLAWQLPGWTTGISLSSALAADLPSSFVQPFLASSGVRRLASLALDLIGRMEPHPLPPDVPRILLPALFLAFDRGWPLTIEHFDTLHDSWEERFLADRLIDLPEHRRSAFARWLWELISSGFDRKGGSQAPVVERILVLDRSHPALCDVVLASLDEAQIEETAHLHGIDQRSTSGTPLDLRRLSPPCRRAAFRGWVRGAATRGASVAEARRLLPLLNDMDVDLAIDLASRAEGEIAGELTAFTWKVAPERAREQARSALEDDQPSAVAWFYGAPRSQLAFLLGLLRPIQPTPAWGAAWLRGRVLHAGTASEDFYRAIRLGLGDRPTSHPNSGRSQANRSSRSRR